MGEWSEGTHNSKRSSLMDFKNCIFKTGVCSQSIIIRDRSTESVEILFAVVVFFKP
jgi:hypothetical protein